MNLKQSLKNTIGLYVFCTLICTMESCSSTRNINTLKEKEKMEWKEVKVDKKNDKPSWKIYTRELVDENLYEYKIEGDINATQKECISSFREDIYNQASNPKNKKYPTYNILNDSEDSMLTYVIHNELFILKNTEMRVQYTFFTDNENNTEGVKWIEAWNDDLAPPLSKKLSRVESFRGAWHFLKNSNNKSKAINTVQVNPKGMPLWLVKPMVTKFSTKRTGNY